MELADFLLLLLYSALFEAVRESNRSKVNALAEDNWMFEAEEQPRIP
jgi:hypothetical protein